MKSPKTYVVDNSVLLKPLLQEEGAGKVEKMMLMKQNFEISILVPDLFRYEFFNRATREFDKETVLEAWNAMTELQMSIIPFQSDLVAGANSLMRKYPKISFYDAAYHALAKAYRVPLITADEKYYAITRKEGDVKMLEDLKI